MHRARMKQLVEEAERAARTLEEKADYGLFGSIRKRYARRLIAIHRGHIWLRDYPKHGLARAFAAQREVVLSVADMLVSEGRLSHRDDVWFLRKDELLDALEKNEPLDVDIEARKIQHERQKELNAPALYTSEGEIPAGKREQKDVPEGALVGTPVSSGVVEGLARVVFDPTKSTVEPGEILVSPSSDPGWTALFLNAAGFVTEVGGYVTHGAIVAREYGIPAVVSVTNATRTIKTGQRIRVDGTRGTVEILE
jgi:phosphohistidine swiveling domain-containing protein